MAADRTSLNREAIEKFASHFDPPLQVVATEAIGGARVAHGWMCAKHMPEHEIGLTAVCWGKGHFKAWLEATGSHDEASLAGQVMAELVDMLKRPFGDAVKVEDIPIPTGDDWIGDDAPSDATEMALSERAVKSWNCSKCGGGDMIGNENEIDVCSYCGNPVEEEYQRIRKLRTENISPQTEQLQALGDDAPLPKQPNPAFIDMMGLSPLERAKACDMYPELRFSINAGKRYDHDGNESERAGFISSEQLEHVNRVIGGHKPYSEDPATCEHKFKKNSIGGGFTCIKCGISGGTDAPPNTPDAAA